MSLVNATSPANTLQGVVTGPSTLVPSEFALRRGYEGPQVIIEWDDPLDPGSIVSFRLVRRLFGFPQDETDGDIVFDGAPAANFIADLDVVACKCYFYKLFSLTVLGDVVTAAFVEGHIIPLETGFYGRKLWALMASLYVVKDQGLEDPTEIRRPLLEGPGATPEVYNFGEDGALLRGPLERLLRLIGPMLDEAKGLVDCFPAQLDVDSSCISTLEGVAALLGLGLNKELAPEGMRNEVRLQVPFLKLKGTIPGLEARFRSVSGLTPIVHEQCNDLLVANDLTTTSPGFTLSEAANIGGPDNELYYSPGYVDNVVPYWLWFTVFANLPAGGGVNEVTAKKWCRSIDDSSPSCHKGFLTLVSDDPEAIGIGMVDEDDTAISDDFSDTIPVAIVDVATDEQIADASKWLIFSDPTKTMSANNWTSVIAAPTFP